MSSSSWGDNPDQTPVDKWIPCTTEYNGQNYSDTSFKLTQKLQIGDFKFALKQNFTETMFVSQCYSQSHPKLTTLSTSDGTTTQTITTTDPYHISNTTAGFPYNCTINPFMNPYNIHASGNCETTAALTIPVTDASPACEFAKTVSLSFPIEVRTEWGDSVYIVGSIPELGNWDLSRAVPLNAEKYTSSKMIWTGGDVKVKAGTTFEWKAVQKNRDGSWTWECGENWVASVDEYTCGQQVVGNDPTWMRCGNH